MEQPLNNSSMNSQRTTNETCDFRLSHKINALAAMILVAHPCATGSSELIRSSSTMIFNHIFSNDLKAGI